MGPTRHSAQPSGLVVLRTFWSECQFCPFRRIPCTCCKRVEHVGCPSTWSVHVDHLSFVFKPLASLAGECTRREKGIQGQSRHHHHHPACCWVYDSVSQFSFCQGPWRRWWARKNEVTGTGCMDFGDKKVIFCSGIDQEIQEASWIYCALFVLWGSSSTSKDCWYCFDFGYLWTIHWTSKYTSFHIPDVWLWHKTLGSLGMMDFLVFWCFWSLAFLLNRNSVPQPIVNFSKKGFLLVALPLRADSKWPVARNQKPHHLLHLWQVAVWKLGDETGKINGPTAT